MTRGRPILSFVAFLSLAYFAGVGGYEAKWESLGSAAWMLRIETEDGAM